MQNLAEVLFLTQFYYFTVLHYGSVYFKADDRAHLMPALLSGCSGIHVKALKLLVKDHL